MKQLTKLVDSLSIVPNKCGHHHSKDVTGTYMCSHILHVKTLHIENQPQPFSIQCKSKEVGKLACIGGVELFVDGSNPDDERRFLGTNQDNRDFYDPTPVELQQGIAFAAPKYWGVHVRRDKSLRVAFIGGSQTAPESVYVESFREQMKETSASMGWKVAVYNEVLNGIYPSTQVLNFLKLTKTEWPNIICIEPCLHCEVSDHWPCSYMIDNLKYFINRQYKEAGLDLPYYIFLEFFTASDKYWQHRSEWLSVTSRVALPVSISRAVELSDHLNKRMFSRGVPYAPFLMDMARFYGIPVLSVTDVLYPSFVRFHLTHEENERWPYTADGINTSDEGCKLIVKHILIPFFLEQMKTPDKLFEK